MEDHLKQIESRTQLANLFTLISLFFYDAVKLLKGDTLQRPANSSNSKKPKQKLNQDKPKIDFQVDFGYHAFSEHRFVELQLQPEHKGTQISVIQKIIANE